MGINRVVITGNLTRDPELRSTSGGMSVLKLGVAVNDRRKNQQIAFGFGAHVCLGQYLARMEMRILMEELLPRLKKIELAGEPARVESVFVGGLKRLPIRFEAA